MAVVSSVVTAESAVPVTSSLAKCGSATPTSRYWSNDGRTSHAAELDASTGLMLNEARIVQKIGRTVMLIASPRNTARRDTSLRRDLDTGVFKGWPLAWRGVCSTHRRAKWQRQSATPTLLRPSSQRLRVPGDSCTGRG